jgi:hypothetical protein
MGSGQSVTNDKSGCKQNLDPVAKRKREASQLLVAVGFLSLPFGLADTGGPAHLSTIEGGKFATCRSNPASSRLAATGFLTRENAHG